MARKPNDEPLTLQRVIQWASTLPFDERRELIDALLALDEVADDEGDRTSTPNGDGNGTGGRGNVELKMINGCGPYLYLRYWSAGKHRSIYLGKAEQE